MPKTPEERRQAQAQYRARPENREKARIASKRWREENPDRRRAQVLLYERGPEARQKKAEWRSGPGWPRTLLYTAARRAEKSGVAITITAEWVAEKLSSRVCAATGLPLSFGLGGRGPWSATLDRVNPQEGYTPENTRVVCWAYNAAKGEGTDADVLAMAKALVGK